MNHDEVQKQILKKEVAPHFYALLLKNSFATMLHVGVYYSLEEAFGTAKLRMAFETRGRSEGLPVSLDLWTIASPKEIDKFFMEVDESQEKGSLTTLAELAKELEDEADEIESGIDGILGSEDAYGNHSKTAFEELEAQGRKQLLIQRIRGEKNRLMKEYIDSKDVPKEKEIVSMFSQEEMKMMKEGASNFEEKKENKTTLNKKEPKKKEE